MILPVRRAPYVRFAFDGGGVATCFDDVVRNGVPFACQPEALSC
jgi:hypothetical protein